MTCHEFNQLPRARQIATVSAMGTHLATRWEDVNVAVLLYHLPSEVFAEVCYDIDAGRVTVRSFAGLAQLADYARFITLPEGLEDRENL